MLLKLLIEGFISSWLQHVTPEKNFSFLLLFSVKYIKFIRYRSMSEAPGMFHVESHSQKTNDPNQLGVVSGPFGQMLQSKDPNSRRGSQYSLGSNNGLKDGKL